MLVAIFTIHLDGSYHDVETLVLTSNRRGPPCFPMLDLRPYQNEALQKVYQAYKAGKRRVIVSLPTGTGKTVVFAHFPKVLRMKKRLLVLAHREELLLQARDKFQSIDPELKAEIEQAGSRAAADAKVVIGSVPTLARNAARLSRLQ